VLFHGSRYPSSIRRVVVPEGRNCSETLSIAKSPVRLVSRSCISGEGCQLARIVSCCDAFNAMTTDRPYRAALSIEEAQEELRRNSGTQFHPEVVDAVIRVSSR
jgi:hypothetical protein